MCHCMYVYVSAHVQPYAIWRLVVQFGVLFPSYVPLFFVINLVMEKSYVHEMHLHIILSVLLL